MIVPSSDRSNRVLLYYNTMLLLIQIASRPLVQIDLPIEEHGTKFKQHMTVDKDNGLIVTEVPAHNGRVAAKFVF